MSLFANNLIKGKRDLGSGAIHQKDRCDITTIMVITEIQGNAIIFSYKVQR